MSSEEDRARLDGWVTLDEWKEQGKPEDSWVPANQFNIKGELMRRIQTQSRKLSEYDTRMHELSETIRELGEHNRKISEVQYKKAMNDLKSAKKAAIEEGDADKIIEIDDHISELKSVKQTDDKPNGQDTTAKTTPGQTVPVEVTNWLQEDQNKWYFRDIAMRGTANQLYLEYQVENGMDSPPSEILRYVETQMKEKFPNEFGLPKKDTPLTTETSSTGTRSEDSKKKYTVKDLSDEQRKIGESFVRDGAFEDIQEYVNDLADMGEIEAR